jgi:hypothetical protein
MRQLSGLPNRNYSLRFNRTAEALERALMLLGCEVYDDGTGMAYCVARGDLRIGGPSSCQEDAMCGAARWLEQETARRRVAKRKPQQ